jgi:putative transposase
LGLHQLHHILFTMKVVRTAKLKLTCSPEQATQLQRVASTYRNAQNHCSRWALDNGRTSSGSAIQNACYQKIRTRYGLASQLACSVRDSVAATYKGLWITTKQAAERRKVAVGRKAAGSWKGRLPRTYKGLDSAPVFKALTLEYQYGRDYSFKKAGHVSVMTLQGWMTLSYEGWNEHVLALQDPGTEVGSAKLWYDKPRKQWYLLAALTVDLPDRLPTDYRQVVGVDVGQRYQAVTKVVDLTGQSEQVQMFEGRTHRRKADQFVFIRNRLQAKGTRSSLRRLVLLSGRKRRFTANRNHVLVKQILAAHPHAIIAMEELAHIRERCLHGGPGRADWQDGYEALRVVWAAYASASSGQPLRLSSPADLP